MFTRTKQLARGFGFLIKYIIIERTKTSYSKLKLRNIVARKSFVTYYDSILVKFFCYHYVSKIKQLSLGWTTLSFESSSFHGQFISYNYWNYLFPSSIQNISGDGYMRTTKICLPLKIRWPLTIHNMVSTSDYIWFLHWVRNLMRAEQAKEIVRYCTFHNVYFDQFK